MIRVNNWFRSHCFPGVRSIQDTSRSVCGPQRRLVASIFSLTLLALSVLTPAAQADPHGCTGADVNYNCNFNNFYSTPYGSAPDGWAPFVLSGSAAFVEAVQQDQPTPVTGHDGRVPVVMGLAAGKSHREGRPVKLSEIG